MHISQLSDRFVEDPREVVKAGQIVQVKVVEVDIPRQRIALTMKLHERPAAGRGDSHATAGSGGARSSGGSRDPRGNRDLRPAPAPRKPEPEVVSPLAAALSKLNLRRN